MVARLLVVGQFLLAAAMAIPGSRRGPVPLAVALFALGTAWTAWTFAINPPVNINIRPVLKAGGRLVTAGPYRLVRHPMYFGVLVLCAGLVCLWPGWLKGAAWAGLLVILVVKARMEEHALARQFPGYDAYRRGRRFLVPWVC